MPVGEKQFVELTADNGNDGSKVSGGFSAAAMNLVWDEGDKIKVSGGATGTLTLDGGAGTSHGHVSGEIETSGSGELVFTWTKPATQERNGEGPNFNAQSGTEEWIMDNLVLESKAAYNDNGKYSLKMEMPYAVLKLDLSAFVGESGNDVEIKAGGNPVATVTSLAKVDSEEVYVAVPEVGENTYTFSGNGKSIEKTWTLEANTFYTAGMDGAAVVIKPDLFVNLNNPELGVTNLPLWAKYNVGVDPYVLVESSDWYGNYYAWGETETKTDYSWETYKYANGGFKKLTKYCDKTMYGDGGYTDNLTTLEASDDAAISNLGSPWRMPTMNEWDDLVRSTYCHWEYDYKGIPGLNGLVVYKVKAEADKGLMTVDQNGGEDWVEWVTYDQDWELTHVTGTYDYRSDLHLFLPAASEKNELPDDMNYHYGYYWSSSLNTQPSKAYNISFSMTYFVDPQSKKDRYYGLPVRPVQPKNE